MSAPLAEGRGTGGVVERLQRLTPTSTLIRLAGPKLVAVAALDLPEHPGVAYLAGEARTIQLVRSHLLRDRGWVRRNVVTKPFWTPGRRGMD